MKNFDIQTLYKLLFVDYPDIVTVRQLQVMLGISRHAAYDLLTDGSIRGLKLGNAYKIPKMWWRTACNPPPGPPAPDPPAPQSVPRRCPPGVRPVRGLTGGADVFPRAGAKAVLRACLGPLWPRPPHPIKPTKKEKCF